MCIHDSALFCDALVNKKMLIQGDLTSISNIAITDSESRISHGHLEGHELDFKQRSLYNYKAFSAKSVILGDTTLYQHI